MLQFGSLGIDFGGPESTTTAATTSSSDTSISTVATGGSYVESILTYTDVHK